MILPESIKILKERAFRKKFTNFSIAPLPMPLTSRSFVVPALSAFFLFLLFSFWGPQVVRANQETIRIGASEYIVPPPWTGHKLNEQKFEYEDFRKVPERYTKEGSKIYILTKAHGSLVKMLDAASEDGVLLQVSSGYRSSSYQKRIFLRMFGEGREFDDIIRYVAPPGYSEHMLGTAVDFSPSNWRFASTQQYKWLSKNGEKFGFRETYPKITEENIPWEAWHWRFSDILEEQH
jgi:LAS superfamily LD-carboxypeptidase LdcB